MKNWLRSKTVWIALLQAAIGVAAITIGVLNGEIGLDSVGLVFIAKSVIDIVIRFKTDTQIKML